MLQDNDSATCSASLVIAEWYPFWPISMIVGVRVDKVSDTSDPCAEQPAKNLVTDGPRSGAGQWLVASTMTG